MSRFYSFSKSPDVSEMVFQFELNKCYLLAFRCMPIKMKVMPKMWKSMPWNEIYLIKYLLLKIVLFFIQLVCRWNVKFLLILAYFSNMTLKFIHSTEENRGAGVSFQHEEQINIHKILVICNEIGACVCKMPIVFYIFNGDLFGI